MKFEYYKDNNNQWRWRLKSKNGRIVAVGESYTRKAAMLKTVNNIIKELRLNWFTIEINEVENAKTL